MKQCSYFAYTLQQSAASATFQPHNTYKISSYTIKIHLLDTTTNISRKVTNYVVKQCFIWKVLSMRVVFTKDQIYYYIFFLPGPIDLAILIDSGSYYGKQWNTMTDFVRELLGSMAFSSEFTQVTRQFAWISDKVYPYGKYIKMGNFSIYVENTENLINLFTEFTFY